MTAVNRLLALLGTRLPLVQAPMAGVQGAALAAAVCEAGALGSVPGATHTPDTLRAELTALRAATDRPWNVNFFCHTTPVFEPAREAAWRATLAPFHAEAGIDGSQVPPGAGRQPFSAALADALEPFAPRVVSFHFGLPDAALVARIKRWGSVVMSSATTVEEGLWLQQHGADVVIAQGLEAGGHRGHFLSDDLSRQMGLMALLPQLVAALDLPVVAAGGLADAAGVRAAMALGAAGDKPRSQRFYAGVDDLVRQGRLNPAPFLRRHLHGDWGDLSDGDRQLNDAALKSGEDRLFSSYQVTPNLKLWIITEWDRSVTTLLLPSEY